MKVYTLTITDTQEGFSPKEVKTFVSKELANAEMLKQVSEKSGIPIENLVKGYDQDGWCVGYDYARDYDNYIYWEIFESEISLRETIIGNLIAFIHEKYVVPARFDDTLYHLINEYSDTQLLSIASDTEFIQENVIGEALYQNVCAAIGGKNDEKTYCAITDYLDSECFTNKEIPEFWELSERDLKTLKADSGKRWFLFMLMICSDEWESFTNDIRIAIDEERPQNDKLFETERRKSFVEQYKYVFCPNHRELCSKLTDEQYFSIMEKNIAYTWKFGGDKTDLRVAISQFFEEARYIIWNFIKKYGIDDLLDGKGAIIDIYQCSDNTWDFTFIADCEEIANYVENLKSNNNITE